MLCYFGRGALWAPTSPRLFLLFGLQPFCISGKCLFFVELQMWLTSLLCVFWRSWEEVMLYKMWLTNCDSALLLFLSQTPGFDAAATQAGYVFLSLLPLPGHADHFQAEPGLINRWQKVMLLNLSAGDQQTAFSQAKHWSMGQLTFFFFFQGSDFFFSRLFFPSSVPSQKFIEPLKRLTSWMCSNRWEEKKKSLHPQLQMLGLKMICWSDVFVIDCSCLAF